MADISFTSYIKPVNSKTFSEVTSNIPKINFADFPWSLEQRVQGKDVFTRNICDCTSCLLTNGKEDFNKSRRVELEIRMKAGENVIEKMLNPKASK